MGKSFCSVALALVVTISGSTFAQEMASIASAPRTEAVLAEFYGRGVHAFFSHDDVKAADLFNRAIAGGSKDPRVFFFRGLTYARQGRTPEAQADFKKGAELEVLGLDRGFRIGRALERVQGPLRTEIELARSEARLTAHNAIELRKQKRYEEFSRDQADTVREPKPVSPGSVVPPPPVPPAPTPVKPAPPAADPFEDDAAPTKPAPPVDEPADAPADDEPADEPPADEEPAAETEDEPAEDEPAEVPADEEMPEDEPSDDKNDDPFGN